MHPCQQPYYKTVEGAVIQHGFTFVHDWRLHEIYAPEDGGMGWAQWYCTRCRRFEQKYAYHKDGSLKVEGGL
jgi:hypothetical protein